MNFKNISLFQLHGIHQWYQIWLPVRKHKSSKLFSKNLIMARPLLKLQLLLMLKFQLLLLLKSKLLLADLLPIHVTVMPHPMTSHAGQIHRVTSFYFLTVRITRCSFHQGPFKHVLGVGWVGRNLE